MSRQGPDGIVEPVDATRDVTIRLELHLTGDHVRGHASTSTGLGREFTGWVGLIAAIDALTEPLLLPPRAREERPGGE